MNYLLLLQVYCSLCHVGLLHVLMGIKNAVIGSDKPQGGTSVLLSKDEKKQNVKATYFTRPHKWLASDKNLFMWYEMIQQERTTTACVSPRYHLLVSSLPKPWQKSAQWERYTRGEQKTLTWIWKTTVKDLNPTHFSLWNKYFLVGGIN